MLRLVFLDNMDEFAQFMDSESTLIKQINSGSEKKKGMKKKKTSRLLAKNVAKLMTII